MQTFKIYQIDIRSLNDEINGYGWAAAARRNPEVHAYLETTTKGSMPWQKTWFAHYTHVANIEAEDLEHAYMISNLGPEAAGGAIERIAPMHSLSVGDILQQPSGLLMMVEPYGFSSLHNPTREAA